MNNKAPEGWSVDQIRNVANPNDKYSFTGGPFGSDLKSDDYTDYGVRIIQLQNIGDGQFKNKYKIYTSEEKADLLHSCNIFPGDIILSKMGDPVARAVIIPSFSKRYVMASDGIRLSVDHEKYDTKFVHDTINFETFRAQAELNSTGSTRKRIGLTQLRELTLLVPPLPEQKKIAAILTSVDDVIEKTQAQIEKLKDLKTGMMQELLTRGVGVDGRPHTEFKDSPVGRIPAEWDTVKLASVLSKIDSGWSPACIEMPPATGEWGVVKVSAVTRGRFLEKESKTLPEELKPKPHIQIKRGDILLTRANGVADLVGKCVMVSSEPKAKLMMSDKILRLNANDKVYSKFLLHYFNSRHIRKQIELSWGGSSGQKNISQADIKGYFIALPSLNEQMIIGDSISQIDTLLSVREAKLRKLEDSKKALMQDLLTGKVRVKVDS